MLHGTGSTGVKAKAPDGPSLHAAHLLLYISNICQVSGRLQRKTCLEALGWGSVAASEGMAEASEEQGRAAAAAAAEEGVVAACNQGAHQ